MKSKTRFSLALLLLAAISFTFITCVDQSVRSIGTDAVLTNLSIGDWSVVSDIATPLIPSEWDSFDKTQLYSADFGRASFKQADKATGKIGGRIRPTVTTGAQAEWGIGTRNIRPDTFTDTRVPAYFDSDEYIYIKVTSEDGLAVNYYRFYAKLWSWTTNLRSISIAGREGKAGADESGVSTGGSSWDEASELSLSIAQGEAVNAIVEAATFDPASTVRYAVVTGDSAPGTFQPATTPLSIKDQDFLYVEVTAENTVDREYFKYRMSVARIATIANLNLNFGGTIGTDEIFGKGLPQESWADVGFGEYSTADQPSAGLGVELVLDDPDASYGFAKLTDPSGAEPAFSIPDKIRFDSNNTNTEVLAIKVTSANGLVTMYYKIKIFNKAANIKTHPKAAWYYRGTPAAPLTVELDRGDPGDYDYQWYEADSWYGFYGRHGSSLDEKNNLSMINGGPDMYYYLVEPDITPSWVRLDRGGEPYAWTIVGANSDSYTPRTDWIDDTDNMTFYGTPTQNNSYPVHPSPPLVYFVTGSTSECRYYWVEVTNKLTGLTVTSDRALILTETDPNMKHFIFDLSILPKKNLVPFKEIRELYQIPLDAIWAANPDVDPSEYEILVAHARYYLPDGRPWTQNWTHGDIHFGMNDNSLVWWQNNLGANSGAIPLQAPHSAQGGLGFQPDWVGVAPSGDPDKGLPPTLPDGSLPVGYRPAGYPTGIAQGYFCGFIELLELRFATAPTN